MARIEVLTKPQGKVLGEYIRARNRVDLIMGPLGSGKTFASCEKILKLIMEQRPNNQGIRLSRVYAIRNTYSDLLTTTIKDWLGLFGDLGKFNSSLAPPPTHHIRFRLPDKTIVQSELVFLALDRPQSIKRLRGSQVTLFWLNEIKELPKPVIDMADGRHGRYPSKVDGGCSYHGMIGDYNAPDNDHWLYRLAEEKTPDNWKFHIQPGGVMREFKEEQLGHRTRKVWTGNWLPNPKAENIHNLPKDYYKAMLQSKESDWIAVNLGNEYGTVHTGQPIYGKQWDSTIHVSPDIKPLLETFTVVGMDFGLTPAAVFLQETPEGITCCYEAVGQGVGLTQFMRQQVLPILHNEYRKCPVLFIVDPAGAQRSQVDRRSPLSVLTDEFKVDAVTASTNDLSVRWDNVRLLLQSWFNKNPFFRIHTRCKFLKKGFSSEYKLRRIQVVGDEKYTSVPDKNIYSHVHEALQYGSEQFVDLVTLSNSSSTEFSRPHGVNY